jgi:hypothetical protein
MLQAWHMLAVPLLGHQEELPAVLPLTKELCTVYTHLNGTKLPKQVPQIIRLGAKQ